MHIQQLMGMVTMAQFWYGHEWWVLQCIQCYICCGPCTPWNDPSKNRFSATEQCEPTNAGVLEGKLSSISSHPYSQTDTFKILLIETIILFSYSVLHWILRCLPNIFFMWVCAHACGCLVRPETSYFPVAEVTGGRGHLLLGAGKLNQILRKSSKLSYLLNHLSSPPVL